MLGIDELRGHAPEDLLVGAILRIARDRAQAREDALDVAVDDGVGAIKRDGGDGPCGVSADPWQRQQRLVVVGDAPVV